MTRVQRGMLVAGVLLLFVAGCVSGVAFEQGRRTATCEAAS